MIQTHKYPKLLLFISGALLAAAFAPIFFIPSLATLAILAYQTKKAQSWKIAAAYGYSFGFGFFTFGLYWMAIGVAVYIEDFWWALPFALFGLPLVLSIFIALGCALSWYFRARSCYVLAFSVIWVFLEWVRSWIFTGLPWNLMGYSLTFSDELIQLASLVGIYGMGFIVVYISAGAIRLLSQTERNRYFVVFMIVLISSLLFGSWRLDKYPTKFTDVKIRIVQPNIPQSDKWDIDTFWDHLNKHIRLSHANTGFKPDLVLWSEAAVTATYHIPVVKERLRTAIVSPSSVLITGGVSSQDKKHYSAIYALNSDGDILFEYHKSHLVPFGEYIPLSSILPLKKLTPGLEDYAEGEGSRVVDLKKLGLKISPLVCYEAIFSGEVVAKEADVIINVTNDTWYGNSSGPYQHFHMARMRAVEHGVPLVRVANSGISAIIDPVGRIISKTQLGASTVLDGFLPQKIAN